MRSAGLFAHLSARDMLVIGPGGPIDNTLRFPNEPARHKLLDLIGDLALVGRPVLADITASRSGHALNAAMARALRGEA
jgi:UDP-3-O-acyl-N-acetylglucosamine deacetylase